MVRRVALITGSGSGLGKRTAIELAKKGHDIVINYARSRSAAEELSELLRQQYQVDSICVQADASNPVQVEGLVQQTLSHFGRLDIVVANAGPYIHERKRLIDYDLDEWRYIIDGNLNSVFYLVRQAAPYMEQQGWGRIITMGFDRAEAAPGWMYRSAFASAKVGLVSLTRTLAVELAGTGITVNMVSPGDVVDPWKEADITQAIPDTGPIGRVGTGEDVARAVAFFCDEASDFVTGSILSVTGAQDVLNKIQKGGS